MDEIKFISRADELNHAGSVLFGQGQLGPARFHFLAALLIEPQHAHALQNLGAVLRNMGHNEAAASVARRSVKANPNNAYALSNLGVSLLSQKNFVESLRVLRDVIDRLPNDSPPWHNYALVLYMTGRFEQALKAFDKAIALAQSPNSHLLSDRALCLLALGRLADGLAAYECRWDILARSDMWRLDIPEWQGEDLSDKSLLVHHEQGFGDSLMLCRFLRLLPKSCRVSIGVPAELVALFAYNFPRAAVFDFRVDNSTAGRVWDYHTPMLSMARHLGLKSISQIHSKPYLRAPAVAYDVIDRLPKSQPFRVGVVWASGDHGPNLVDRRRLVPVTAFLPLTEIPEVAVISLQKGAQAQDLERFGMEGLIFDLNSRLGDFATTAAVIQGSLDVVISVDSAVAHLAGALGVPTIMLSPYSRCWRWWNACVNIGEPWYQNMRVYSQSENGTWDYAVRSAIREVTKFVATRPQEVPKQIHGQDIVFPIYLSQKE